MANVKKGNLAPPPQWWKHLRDWKRTFWKRERRSQDKQAKRDIGCEILEGIREIKRDETGRVTKVAGKK